MFDPSSRYFNLKDKKFIANKNRYIKNDEKIITYKERRFIPLVKEMEILKEISTVAGDRLDDICYKLFGDPELYWQICDINNIMHPLQATNNPGKILKIGIPSQI